MGIKLKIFSLLSTLMIVFSSVLQFHHHDELGNVCLYQDGNEQTSTCCASKKLDTNQNTINTAENEHHQNDESNCALKLDNIAKSKQQISYTSDLIISCIILLHSEWGIVEIKDNNSKRFISKDNCILDDNKYFTTLSHRGPPVL